MKRLLIRIGIVLVLWLCTEASIPALYSLVSAPSDPNVGLEGMLGVIHAPHDYSVLFLGDSTVTQGVIPAEFDALTGEDSYVFGSASGAAGPEDAILLDEYLATHAAPKAVFVVRSPAMWRRAVAPQVIREAPRNMRLALFLYRQGALPLGDYAEISLTTLLPSAHHRYRFSRVLSAMMDEQVRTTFEKDYADAVKARDIRLAAKGFARITSTLTSTREQSLQALRTLMPAGEEAVRPENIALLTYMCERAREYGTHLYVTLAPYSGILTEDASVKAALDDIASKLEAATADDPSCTYLPAVPPYPDSAMSDETHANATGALMFTNRLAQVFGSGARR